MQRVSRLSRVHSLLGLIVYATWLTIPAHAAPETAAPKERAAPPAASQAPS